ncbi:biosynthetic-type acetolactate synthase large subunit [Murimonas intestini]|uniref:Acetolactate synthase n=1 Tax=Murimonas intestini TaxID=1337051 RepID=A0AB73T9R6_9FIRM|nr:biosynthetic-type acetolactate synthase large subunit [Murimonas intestini]MCR1839279.1 biosynthetic-type acetolactate synthase large subunit [Murimonas intestini]MCR1864574.1 biosynthetic-type acetolactate synthase large subunit [Murimonas intestini]MCR1882184.1 biosynthetic-type acetolactate synthase large subunit [Murimonas intestini]
MEMKGTELFVKALKEEGVETLFAYPGGMAIDLFDALYGQDEIDVVLPRHEQGLIHAADGYARSTGKTGVCLVTSGPGATNLVTGIATANFDSVPLVCFTGQVPTHLIGNDAFQEVDIVGVTRNICKYAVTVREREKLGEVIKKAFYIARTGKPGPVLVDIPKDIQQEYGSGEYPDTVTVRGYRPNTGVHAGQIRRAMDVLEKASRPVFLIGGGVNIARAQKEMTMLTEKTGVPVITTIMGKGAIPTSHPNYVGNIGMHGNYASNQAVTRCDVLFSIGTRFNDRITGKINEFAPHAKIIHIDIDTASISRNIQVDIPIVADAREAILKMLEDAKPLPVEEWKRQISEWKEEYPIHMKKYQGMTPQIILEEINKMFPESIVVTDVGQNQLWTTQYLELDEKRQLLTSGGLGTMGYGFPAAIGAQIGNPDKTVICVSGDGGMQMNIQEMATAVALELPVIICVLNNGYLGNVRQWQEMFFDKRYSSTCLCYRRSCERDCMNRDKKCPKYSPDFIKLAESYDAAGIRVECTEDIRPAFERAKANKNSPTLIEFIIEREANVLPIVPGGNAIKDMIMDC